MSSVVGTKLNSGTGSFINLLKFDFNIFWGNKLYIWSLFLFPFLIGIINVIMIPVYSGSWVYFLTTTIPSLLIFVNMKYSFRKSGLQSNNKLTKNNTLVFYLESFICYLILFTLFTLSFLLMFTVYGNVLGIFKTGYLGQSVEVMYLWFSIPWFNLTFFILYYSLLNFSFYLICSRFISDKKFFIMIILSLVIISIPCGGLVNQELRQYFSGDQSVSYINSNPENIHNVILKVAPLSSAFNFSNLGKEYIGINYDVYSQQKETYLKILNDMAFVFFPWNGIGQYFTINVIQRMMLISKTSVIDTSIYPPFSIIDFSIDDWQGKIEAWRFINPRMFSPSLFSGDPEVNYFRLEMFIIYPLIHIMFYNIVAFSDKLRIKFKK